MVGVQHAQTTAMNDASSPNYDYNANATDAFIRPAQAYQEKPPHSPTYGQVRPSRAWQPLWLHIGILLALMAGFLLMLVTTIVLFVLSQRWNGLVRQDESWHYAWTYGPTAVFILATAFWFMVDTTTKTLAPWAALRSDQPSPAKQTVTLDYLSPLMPVAWWRAIQNRHWAVVLTITGYALLNLGTVFSSGLMVLRPTSVTRDVSNLISSLKLSAEDFFFSETVQPVTAAPAVNFYGVRLLGLERPEGTTDELVVTPIAKSDATNSTNGVNYTAVVPGFLSTFECEEYPLNDWKAEYLPWLGVNDRYYTANISLPDCQIGRIILGKIESTWGMGVRGSTNKTEAFVGRNGEYTCNLGRPYNGYNDSVFINSTADHRRVITVTRFEIAKMEPPQNVTLDRVVALVCKQSYRINRYRVSYESRSGLSPIMTGTDLVEETDDMLQGYAPADASVLTDQAINRLELGSGGDDYVFTPVPPMFRFMSELAGNVSIGTFMDPGLLSRYSGEVIKGVSTFLTHEYLMLPNSTSIDGQITDTEERLWVQALSTGVICAVLVLLIAFTVIHIFIRPNNVVPHDPNNLLNIASMLHTSPGLRKMFRVVGHYNDKELMHRMEGHRFQSRLINGALDGHTALAIDCATGNVGTTEPVSSQNSPQSMKWWYPQAARIWFAVLAVILPLGMIVTLEVIQNVSDKDQGFVALGQRSAGFQVDAELVSRYLPVILALIVVAMYSSLAFAATTIARFLPMRQTLGEKSATATASRTVCFSAAGKSLPVALYRSIAEKHFGLGAIIAATVVARFLTILAAGLYKTVDLPQTKSTSLQQQDTFDLRAGRDLASDDRQAASLTNLIEFSGLDFPQWTYENLVFHSMKAPNLDMGHNQVDGQATVKATVPAFRATLDCMALRADSRELSVVDDGLLNKMMTLTGIVEPYSSQAGFALVMVNGTLPWSLCDRRPADLPSNVTTSEWYQYFKVPIQISGLHAGMATQLDWLDTNVQGDGAVPAAYLQGGAYTQTEQLGCPSLAITLGSLTVTNGTSGLSIDSDLGTLLCYQQVEEVVSVSTEFNIPSFNISSVAAPQPDETTVRLLPNPGLDETSTRFEFPLNSAFTALDGELGEKNNSLAKTIPSYNDIDQFLRLIISRNAKNGRTETEVLQNLSGEANVDALRDAIQPFYSRYMAQAISQNMRVTTATNSVTSSAQSSTIEATATLPGARRRVTQQRGPKLALQIMLACMVVAAIITRVSMRGMTHALPHNPLSILGAGTLLADGGWIDELVQEESRRASMHSGLSGGDGREGGVGKSMRAGVVKVGQEDRRNGKQFDTLLADRVFGLGWWEGDPGRGGAPWFGIQSWRTGR